MVEGARLESVCASDGTAGSNPVLSAIENTRSCNRVLSNILLIRYEDN